MQNELAEHYRLETIFHPEYIQHTNYTDSQAPGWKQIEEWRAVSTIGSGSFGVVRSEREDRSGKLRAIKEIYKPMMPPAIDWRREIIAMATLAKYPHAFIEFRGWFEDADRIYIAMELAENGDLGSYLNRKGPLSEAETRYVAQQLLYGLEIIHKHDFTHRDLKPQNIFITSSSPLRVKIGDFGISKRAANDTTKLRTAVFTPDYAAPEVVRGDETYTKAVDIWSLGCVLHQILTNRTPFPDQFAMGLYVHGIARFPSYLTDHGISGEGIDFVQKLLAAQAGERPLAHDAAQDPWVRGPSGKHKMPADSASIQLKNKDLPAAQYGEKSSARDAAQDPRVRESSDKHEKHEDSANVQLKNKKLPATFADVDYVSLEEAARRAVKIFDERSSDQYNNRSRNNRPSPPRSVTTFPGIRPSARDTAQDPRVRGPSDKHKKHEDSANFQLKNTEMAGRPSNKRNKPLKIHTLKGSIRGVRFIAFSPDGTLVASASTSSTVRLGHYAKISDFTLSRSGSLKGHNDDITAINFSSDGRMLASASKDCTVRLWDTVTRAQRQVLQVGGPKCTAHAVAFSPDGKLVACGLEDKTVQLWDVGTGIQCQKLEGHNGIVYAVAFSPNGKLIATGSQDKTVRLWDVATGLQCENLCLVGHHDKVYVVTFSPDSKMIASGSQDAKICLWDAATGEKRWTSHAHIESVYCMDFSPDGRFLVSGSKDRTVQVWDVMTGAQQLYKFNTGPVFGVTFLPDGRNIVCGCDRNTYAPDLYNHERF